MKQVRLLLDKVRRQYRRQSIQVLISLTFTLAAVVCLVAMALILYAQFTSSLRSTILKENQQLVSQIALNVESYTRNMRGVSDSVYYSVIKNADLDTDAIDSQMELLYEAHKDSLVSVACYTEGGELVASAPLSVGKPGLDVTAQDWFTKAQDKIENNHFSTPHVQNLFEDQSGRHRWVVSLSRMVELSRGGAVAPGVLLVDVSYSGLERIFTEGQGGGEGYVYLIDKNGEIIYHPKQRLIYSGLVAENNLTAASYADGIHEETFEGVGRQIVVKDTGYTGWRIICVIPNSEFSVTLGQMPLLVVAIVGFAILLIVLVNSQISSLVARPIKRLDRSVRALEAGQLDAEITIGGSHEIEHLGRTIQSTVDQMRSLMDDVVREQEQKRKSEFDALQAQINPHFLYNTLDSIVWMIESEEYKEAISMVTALASLFRISLSKGRDVISIGTELQHAGYYLHIQNIRYKNKFRVETDIDPAIEDLTTIKLIIQPLLENAIYHAMELMDGDGVITVRGRLAEDGVYIEVADNGLGMTEAMAASLLAAPAEPPPGEGRKKGSGIGLRNVHQRIRLYYGAPYGLRVDSELDVGTTVTIHLPGPPAEASEGGTP